MRCDAARLAAGRLGTGGIRRRFRGIGGLPTLWAQNIKDIVLNQAGSPVAAIPKIAEQTNKDLGFTVRIQVTENYDI